MQRWIYVFTNRIESAKQDYYTRSRIIDGYRRIASALATFPQFLLLLPRPEKMYYLVLLFRVVPY